jgi:phosphoadenosine phosphosulfate reductase
MESLQHIIQKIESYKKANKSMFISSSFQTHSIPLLHILSQIDNSIPVVFLNTGYLFPETILYRDKIAALYNLNIINLTSNVPRHMQKDAQNKLLFTSDPDYCCHINKVAPLEPLLWSYDIWINGIRADQNSNRKSMDEEVPTPQRAMRYHPMLNWSNKMIWNYIKTHNIPHHPLDSKGYSSIGCEPCTRKTYMDTNGDERLSRWFGLNKTECGLHTELVKK